VEAAEDVFIVVARPLLQKLRQAEQPKEHEQGAEQIVGRFEVHG
jgi:hypothetical protein